MFSYNKYHSQLVELAFTFGSSVTAPACIKTSTLRMRYLTMLFKAFKGLVEKLKVFEYDEKLALQRGPESHDQFLNCLKILEFIGSVVMTSPGQALFDLMKEENSQLFFPLEMHRPHMSAWGYKDLVSICFQPDQAVTVFELKNPNEVLIIMRF